MRWLREWYEIRRKNKLEHLLIQDIRNQLDVDTVFVIDGVCEDCPGPDWCECDQGIDCD